MDESVFSTIEHLEPGNHLCCIYRSEEEHRRVITPFVRLGLQENHRVIYIVDTHTADTVRGFLQEEGVEVGRHEEQGRLVMLTRHDTYTSGGKFDPDAMIELLKAETKKALEEGYGALRVTGEMTWALTGVPGTGRLIEYENKLNRFMPEHRCIAICQYDKRRFSPEVLLDVLRTHPYAIIGTEVYENFYYLPPDQLLGDQPVEAELENWINNLQAYRSAQQELQASSRRYRNLYNSIRDAILVTDNEQQIVHCNQAFTDLFGYSLQELAGRRIGLLHADEDEMESLGRRIDNISGQELLFTVHYQKKNGEVFPGETKLFTLTDTAGGADGYIGLIRDISEKMRVEEELRREKQFVEAIFETSGALITAIDPEGRILQINDSCELITGYSREEMKGEQLAQFIPEEEKTAVNTIFQELLEGNYPNQHQNHWITKDGGKRFIAWTNTVIPAPGGGVESIISTGIDITERKEEEENRIRKLEAELSRLEQFSSSKSTAVTGRLYAQKSFREAETDEFERLKGEYEQLLEDRMEERIYKTDKGISPRLQAIARSFGRAAAGPRDVVELHVTALKRISSGTSYKRAQALTEEGRLLAMELMGYLVSFYRNQISSNGGQA